MKLIRYGQPGAERPGLVDAQGTLRDLSMLLPDIGPAQLNPRTLSALAAIDASRLPAVYGSPRLGSPVGAVGKIVCVGSTMPTTPARPVCSHPPSPCCS